MNFAELAAQLKDGQAVSFKNVGDAADFTDYTATNEGFVCSVIKEAGNDPHEFDNGFRGGAYRVHIVRYL